MKARVYVKMKSTVLDPQGATIQRALAGLGHPEITGVRQGKYFEIEISDAISQADAEKNLAKIAEDVLANPVIEDYRIEFAS
jgi:phosphoribosylformylglycinamidine synthase